MRHTYRCPLRWADMDLLGHINNVAYVDYLQEARLAFFAQAGARILTPGDGATEGLIVVRTELRYVASLVFSEHPVNIDTWVEDVRAASLTLGYEIWSESEAGRVTYVLARSVLAPYVFGGDHPRRLRADEREWLERWREPAGPPLVEMGTAAPVSAYPLTVRWSDLDAYQHVNNTRYLEYFQEARIHYLRHLGPAVEGHWAPIVVAAAVVEYRRQMGLRAPSDPGYEVLSRVSKVGTSSFSIYSEIHDGSEVCARATVVMVSMNADATASAPIPEGHRERLRAELG